MSTKRFHTILSVILSGICCWVGLCWGSDSIVGWTTAETIISNGTTTLSTGAILPVYAAPGIGKYILIDGKRYVEAGNNRFVLPMSNASPTSETSDDEICLQRFHKHHPHPRKHSDEDWKKIDAERNASMTPSQKIYRDLKKNIYPELFEKR
ncbi:MAG: hypothetical protein AB1547_04305 [Thermodesulfobacteriota bacterium]